MENLCTALSIRVDKIEKSIINGKKTALAKRTVGFFENKFQELKKAWAEFDQLDSQLRELIANSKLICTHDYMTKEKYLELETKYIEYLADLTDQLAEKNDSGDRNTSVTEHTFIHSAENRIPLPRINLPKFSGDYASWRSFHDLFVSMVHSNKHLLGVQKLHYLKGCLSGEAEQLLKHIPITDQDYLPAWEKLQERYENKRLLINTQLNILTNQPKQTTENSKSIKSILDTTTECIHQLRALQVNVEHWDTILIFLIVQKLPFVTLKLWEEELGDTQSLQTFDQFQKFLQTRFRVLESMAYAVTTKTSIPTTKVHLASSNPSKCPACDSAHFVGRCQKFIGMQISNRRDCIQKAGRCFNCFSSKHRATSCPCNYRCRQCKGLHHTLLHVKEHDANSQTRLTEPKASSSYIPDGVKTFLATQMHNALLATALVIAKDRNGRLTTWRCLMDPGSQTSFITEAAYKRMGLRGQPTKIQITSLNKKQAAWSYLQVNVELGSCQDSSKSIKTQMLVINAINNSLPTVPVRLNQWSHIKGLQLADSTYWKPGPIDMLLGAKVYADILQDGVKRGTRNEPIAINTMFGWILLGNTNGIPQQRVESFAAITQNQENLEQQLRQFWETEEVATTPRLKPQDEECEEKFKNTHKRCANGQYEVELPFINGHTPTFGPSRALAMKRYQYLRRKLKQNPKLEKEYATCLNEYITMGHMERIDKTETRNEYYIPHHAVLKESSTTKLRVVFDASAKSVDGKSLNEQLLIGPTIQPRLFSTLLKWRKHKIALTADVEKMYRMILLKPEHRIYQKIIWEDPATNQLQDFQLKTVTFGTSSAPFLAIRTLQQLAQDEEVRFPIASKITKTDFYVDDVLTGADTVAEATEIQTQLINMLNAGGFKLRKWVSNNQEILSNTPIEFRGSNEAQTFNEYEAVKTLGIQWYPNSDYFSFIVTQKANAVIATKRTILSEVASLYDPLGWLGPVIVLAKILIQNLWITGHSWDTKVDDNINNQWQKFKDSLHAVQLIKIPRWIGLSKQSTNIQIHGFCDASIKAYAAVIYMRIEDSNGNVISNLLTSKTKVAPIKPTTVPRLELNAAVLLARLLNSTIVDMQLMDVPIFAWADSMIALQWIRSHPTRWKTYVANRVTQIQDLTNPENWKYVSTKDNPADIASRGILANNLLQHKLWWLGPDWLVNNCGQWPNCEIKTGKLELEAKKLTPLTFFAKLNTDILEKYSSFMSLTKTLAYVNRFIHNCSNKDKRKTGQLSVSELQIARNLIYKLVQKATFGLEYELLKNNKLLPKGSKLTSLNPFLDKDEVMRVGGRLENAAIPYNIKHPIILPSDHHITRIIIDQLHKDTLHGGLSLMINTSRHLYWILNAKRTIARKINSCRKCIAFRKEKRCQLMGNLPAARVNMSKPFTHVGIDYAGPISLKTSSHRAARTYKGYFCIFVCMATKAIHLELTSDLTSAAFIATLKRFVARRGLCQHIYSNCGTNFKGGNTTLQRDIRLAIKDSMSPAAEYFTDKGITWHFNLPASPHCGGLWEAGVKSVKYHLRRVVGRTLLTFEEHLTLLTQIEACVNSRPLCRINNNVNDLEVLTPGHFLIGQPLNLVPEPELKEARATFNNRWKHIQYMTQQFWSKWSIDYLHSLQQRPKWQNLQPTLKIGDIVLVKEDNLPPTSWALGRITEVFPGADNIIRVVQVKTQNNNLRRHIRKICLLPVESEQTN